MAGSDLYTYIPTTFEQYAKTFTIHPILALIVIGSLLLAVAVLGVVTIRRARGR